MVNVSIVRLKYIIICYYIFQIEQELRNRKLAEDESLDIIFCSLQSILQTHEMFSMVLASRMNEWTVEGKLGDIICASVGTIVDNYASFLYYTSTG